MRTLVLGLAALIGGLCSSSASAAFIFTFQTPNISNSPGASGPINLIASTTAVGPEIFSVSTITLNFTNNVGTITQTQTINPATLFVATPTGNPITGLLSYTISPAAVINTFDSFTATITGVDFATAGNFSVATTGPAQTITAVPEPSSLALLGLVAVGGGAYRRFRKKSAAKA